MLSRLTLALCAAALAFPQTAAAKLSPAEQKMTRTVDAEHARTVAMLGTWVMQNSGTLNLPGVAAVGRMLRPELEQLGFTVEWIEMKAAGRAGHIVATHKGNGRGKKMLLIGHLDTVFEPHSTFQTWEIKDGKGIGPGSGDDKGGMAVMIAALRAMHAAGTLKDADIKVVLTGDEEDPGAPIAISRKDLIAAGQWADVALDFEGLVTDGGKDMGSIARRSSGAWTVTVTAKSGHSSGVFGDSAGHGAVYELARIIDTFRKEVRDEKLTYNVGLIGGGESAVMDGDKIRISATGKTNIIAPIAIARGDIRALSNEQIERTQAKMRAIVAQPLNGAKAEITFDDDGYPPMAATEASRALLGKLNIINADLGLEAMGELDASKRGAADIGFVAQDVDALLAGLGADGSGSHAPGESVDLVSIRRQAKRAAILMSRLAGERR